MEPIIRELEEREARAMLAGEVAVLAELWSDRLLVNSTANLIAGKDILLEVIRSGRLRFSRYERVVTRLSCAGEVAIATGNEVTELIGIEPALEIFCSYMNVWQLEDDSWRLAARHVGLIENRGKMRHT
jgi:Domain of unknown function (DUF4440)